MLIFYILHLHVEKTRRTTIVDIQLWELKLKKLKKREKSRIDIEMLTRNKRTRGDPPGV